MSDFSRPLAYCHDSDLQDRRGHGYRMHRQSCLTSASDEAVFTICSAESNWCKMGALFCGDHLVLRRRMKQAAALQCAFPYISFDFVFLVYLIAF